MSAPKTPLAPALTTGGQQDCTYGRPTSAAISVGVGANLL